MKAKPSIETKISKILDGIRQSDLSITTAICNGTAVRRIRLTWRYSRSLGGGIDWSGAGPCVHKVQLIRAC